jgi:hypothetical protein
MKIEPSILIHGGIAFIVPTTGLGIQVDLTTGEIGVESDDATTVTWGRFTSSRAFQVSRISSANPNFEGPAGDQEPS